MRVCDIMFNERDRYNALPDIIHICTPSLACLYRIPDIIVAISLACTFIILVQLCYVSIVNRNDICPSLLFTIGEDINKLLAVATTLMSIRVVCILVTYYPSCVPYKQREHLKPYELGHDFMFSGHTSVIILLALFNKEYMQYWGNTQTVAYIYKVIHACYIVGPFSVAISRQHYTIDVIIAMVLSHILFDISFHPETITKYLIMS